MIRTKTTYTKEVFNDFAKHNIKTSGSMKVIYACAVIILACALVMLVLGSITEGVIYGILGLIFAGYSPLMKAIINSNNKRNIGTTDEYEFYDDRFDVVARDKNGLEMATSSIMYSRLYKVKRNFGYGYIYVNKQVAYIILRENFEDPLEFDLVLDKIQKEIKGSKIKGTTPAVFGSQNVTPATEEGEQDLGEPVPPPETEEDILARKALEAQKAAEEAEAENAEGEEVETENSEDVSLEQNSEEANEDLTNQENTSAVETQEAEEPVDETLATAEKALEDADRVLENPVELDETEEVEETETYAETEEQSDDVLTDVTADNNYNDVNEEADDETTFAESDNFDDNDDETGNDAAEQQPVDEVVNNFIVNEVNDIDLAEQAEEIEEETNQENPQENYPFVQEQPEFVEDNYDEMPEPVDPYQTQQPVVNNLSNNQYNQTVVAEEPQVEEEEVEPETDFADEQPKEVVTPVVYANDTQPEVEEDDETELAEESEEDDDEEEKPVRKRKKRATTKKKTALTEKRGRGRPPKAASDKPQKPKRGRGRPKKEDSEKEQKPKRGRGRPPKAESEKKSAKKDAPKRGRGRPKKSEVEKKTTKKVATKKAVKPVEEAPASQDVAPTPAVQKTVTVVTPVANMSEPTIQSAEPAGTYVETQPTYEAEQPVVNTYVQPAQPVEEQFVQEQEVYNETAEEPASYQTEEQTYQQPVEETYDNEEVETQPNIDEPTYNNEPTADEVAEAEALLREYGEEPSVQENNFDNEPVIENNNIQTEVDKEYTVATDENAYAESVENDIPEAPVRFTETIADDPNYQPVQPLSAQIVEEPKSEASFTVDTSDETDDAGSDDDSVNIGSMPEDI